MSEITAITPQVKDKTRCNIYLDGQYYCPLKFEVVVQYRLKVGQTVTEYYLNEIQLESEKSVALDKAMTYLTASQKTEKQVSDYLYRKGYLPAVVKYVLEKLREYRFVDDKDYAETYVENSSFRKGKRLIQVDLYKKGISKEQIEEALDGLDGENQLAGASAIAQKYMRSKEPTRENLAKAFRYLMSKGFDYEVSRKALESLGNLGEDEE